MEWAYTFIPMELYMKDNLKKIKKLDMGFISGSMEDCMRGTGTKESSTDSESYSMIKNYLS
jgi:hypothetical protein